MSWCGNMRIEHRTSLDKTRAHMKVNTLLSALERKFDDYISNPRKSWNGSKDRMKFSVSIYGVPIAGTITIEDSMITLEGTVPLLARPFQHRIRDAIESVMKEELA